MEYVILSLIIEAVIEFCHGLIAAGMRGVFNNRLTMKVLYEANSITNDIRDSGLQGIVRLEFGQGKRNTAVLQSSSISLYLVMLNRFIRVRRLS